MVTKSSSSNKKKLFQKLNNKEKTIALVVLAALLVGTWLPGRIIVSTTDLPSKKGYSIYR